MHLKNGGGGKEGGWVNDEYTTEFLQGVRWVQKIQGRKLFQQKVSLQGTTPESKKLGLENTKPSQRDPTFTTNN